MRGLRSGADHRFVNGSRSAQCRVAWLDDDLRAAVILVYWEGYTQKEAATILQCKPGTVGWRLHEARKQLSSLFEEETLHYG